MGLLTDISEPESPPPIWTPAKNNDFWRKPSRWQICMPRLRLYAKVILSVTFMVLVFRFLHAQAPPLDPPLSGEDELRARGARGDWPWRDFELHDGLVRGLSHFQTCSGSGQNCVSKPPKPIKYDPYKHFPEEATDIVSCIGVRGIALNESDDDALLAYPGKAHGAVDPIIGSYKAAGLDGDVSFDRFGRLQPYGLDHFENIDRNEVRTATEVDWDRVNWGELQENCVDTNKERFKPVGERPENSIQYSNLHHKHDQSVAATDVSKPSAISKVSRTAILIRVWTGAIWSADAVMNIRAMINEAGLASGGKYQVFILLHVKDEGVALFTGEDQPASTIRKNVPPEFHSITEVWNHAQIRSLYSNLAEHAFVGRSPWMIVQWFARNHPEFDFFYQWEFDVRYTGHYLDFFEAIAGFGRQQPRKGIWERAGRLYIPSVHGEYDTDFRWRTRNEDPHHIWGPVAVEGVVPRGPQIPRKQDTDDYEWGVGEDADWIGFLPSFNVTDTNWYFRDHLWGYSQGADTPRRATLIAQGRVSRRLLEIMNYENAENNHLLDAEMFPQTMCLHHGLKSTSFPHPIYSDRHWTPEVMQATFNGGPHGQAGGHWNSTFSKWNEYAWKNMTWYYDSAQARPLYQHLLGIVAGETGGEEWEQAFGRAVVRPMLLHPVKGAKSWHWTPDGWREL